MTTTPDTTTHRPPSPTADLVWLLWDCTDPVGVFTTRAAALESRADLQHQLLCDYGPNPELLETITITTARVPAACVGADRSHR